MYKNAILFPVRTSLLAVLVRNYNKRIVASSNELIIISLICRQLLVIDRLNYYAFVSPLNAPSKFSIFPTKMHGRLRLKCSIMLIISGESFLKINSIKLKRFREFKADKNV